MLGSYVNTFSNQNFPKYTLIDPQGQIPQPVNQSFAMLHYSMAKTQDSAPLSNVRLAEPSFTMEPSPLRHIRVQHPLRDSEKHYEEYYCATIPPTMGLPRSSAEKSLRSTIYPAIWDDAAYGPNERIAWPNWTLGAFMNTKPSLFVENSNFSHAALIDMIQNNFAFRPQTHYRPPVIEPWDEIYCKADSGKETRQSNEQKAQRRAEEMDPRFWNGEWFKIPKNHQTGFKQDSLTGLHYWNFKRLDARVYMGGCYPSPEELEAFDYSILEKNPQYNFKKGRTQMPVSDEPVRNPFADFDSTVEVPMSSSYTSDESFGCIGIGDRSGLEAATKLAPNSLTSLPARPKRPVPINTSSASSLSWTPSITLHHTSTVVEDVSNESVFVERLQNDTVCDEEQHNQTHCCCKICDVNGDNLSLYGEKPNTDVDGGEEFDFSRRPIQRAQLFPRTLLPEVDAFTVEGIWGEEFQVEKREAEHAEGLYDGRAIIEQEIKREEEAQQAELRKSMADALAAEAQRAMENPTPVEVDLGADLYIATYEIEDIVAVDDLRKETAGLVESEQFARAMCHNKAVQKQLRAYHKSHYARADRLKAEAESMWQTDSRSTFEEQGLDYFLGPCEHVTTTYEQEVDPFEVFDILVGDSSSKRASDGEVMT